MDGKEVLWLPGTDHAGIATQNVVEKRALQKAEIKHRDDLGREALVEQGLGVEGEDTAASSSKQLRALGASCDWSRTRSPWTRTTRSACSTSFVDLYKKGLIYRGKRMVNWCPASLTALSDEEVNDEARQRHDHYRVRYEWWKRPAQFIEVKPPRAPRPSRATSPSPCIPKIRATQHLIGKHVYRALPLECAEGSASSRSSATHVAVDKEFGTGVAEGHARARQGRTFEIGRATSSRSSTCSRRRDAQR